MAEALCWDAGNLKVILVEGDITKVKADAIVNPANSLMIMGGGVAGAIKRAGGQEIEDEARRHAPVPVGRAVATEAGRLKAKYVIHAPTMRYPAMRIGVKNVAMATKAAINLAKELGVKSVAFPAMGAGVGGVPPKASAKTMTEVIKDSGFTGDVIFVAYGAKAFSQMREGIEEVLGSPSECSVDYL